MTNEENVQAKWDHREDIEKNQVFQYIKSSVGPESSVIKLVTVVAVYDNFVYLQPIKMSGDIDPDMAPIVVAINEGVSKDKIMVCPENKDNWTRIVPLLDYGVTVSLEDFQDDRQANMGECLNHCLAEGGESFNVEQPKTRIALSKWFYCFIFILWIAQLSVYSYIAK